MTLTEPSAELVARGKFAGYEYARLGESFRFSTAGGGTSFYIRPSDVDHGWYTVTESERGAGEDFAFSAACLDVVEKFFWTEFGFAIRMSRSLPSLVFPLRPENVAPGYSLTSAGKDLVELRYSNTMVIARACGDLTGLSLLVKLSNIICYSQEELRASYQDPAGRPIFPRSPQK